MESNNVTEKTKLCSVSDSNSKDGIHYIDELHTITESIEHFPDETFHTIFSRKHNNSLLKLIAVSPRYESIARKVFTERYADNYFIIDGVSEWHQNIYSVLFSQFGDSIKAIQVNGIRQIDENHWLVQLLNKHTPNLKKLYFKKCSFKNVDDFLSKHTKITHLSFRGGACVEKYRIQLPEYRNLKSLELFQFSHIFKPSLEQILCNNPKMERLILISCGNYFKLADIMELIYKHLNHLKELNLLDCDDYTRDAPLISLDKFVSVLTSLESFGMKCMYDLGRGLLRRISSKCKHIKYLELSIYLDYYNGKEMVKLVSSFDQIETLSLVYHSHQKPLELIIENLPNLRCLSVYSHRTNDQILTILRKCKNLEKLVIKSLSNPGYRNESSYGKNSNFHDEFIKHLPTPHTTIEYIENDEVIGIITKDEIIWRNKLLHWVGYNPKHNYSNLRLLDLATVPDGSIGKHKQPLNLIFNYLDLNSLYSFGMANKASKQLVHNYIYQRCKQSSKKRLKYRSIERDKFYITDEFGVNYSGLRMFGKNIRYLEVNLLDYSGVQELLNEIEKHCKSLTKLCFHTRYRIDPHIFIIPQIRHYIYYGYGMSEEYIFHCDLIEISKKCPNLEIFEIRTPVRLYMGTYGKQKISFQHLKKFKFQPFDNSQIEYAKDVFKSTDTEIVIDS